jgi:YD repeat-containing protein
MLGWVRMAARLLLAVLALVPLHGASAQDIATEFTASPVFEQVDERGVDVIEGNFNVKSPVLSAAGSAEFYFQWNGRSWRSNVPSLWLGADGFVVAHQGKSDMFPAPFVPPQCQTFPCPGSFDLLQYKPNVGAKLDCDTKQNLDWIIVCAYTSRHGVTIPFTGFPNSGSNFPSNRTSDYFPYGNRWTSPVAVTDPAQGVTKYTPMPNGNVSNGAAISINYPNGYRLLTTGAFNQVTVSFTLVNDAAPSAPGQSLTFTTPNANPGSLNNSYGTPKSTVQTITDQLGKVWKYTFDSNRNVTRVEDPTGVFVTLTYDGDRRVKTFNNGAGTWLYAYSSSNGIGTTTVTDPASKVRTYRYKKKQGYVTQYIDELSRTVNYVYDTTGRMTSRKRTDGAGIEYSYDARGNVSQVRTYPVTASGLPPRIQNAEFPATCTDITLCNRPHATIDARGERTDYSYVPGRGTVAKMTGPAVNGIRPETRYEYTARYARISDGAGGFVAMTDPAWLLVRERTCRTTAASGASCAGGAADEVVIDYDYGPDSGPNNLLLRGVATTADGQTLRTCFQYDARGRKISETKPAANLSACP